MRSYFYLKSRKTLTTSVMVNITHDSKHVQLATGIVVEVKKHWKPDKKHPYRGEVLPGFPTLRSQLLDIQKKIETVCNEFIAIESNLTKPKREFEADLKASLILVLRRKKDIQEIKKAEEIKREKSFLEHFEAFIKDRETNPKYGEGIIKIYRTCYNQLVEYSKLKKITLTFEAMDEKFFNSFTKYLSKYKVLRKNEDGETIEITKQRQKSAIGKAIKTLVTFLNNCYSKKNGEKITDFRHDPKVFEVWKSPEDISFALDSSQIDTLEKLELNDRLSRVRDLFVIQISTGLRVSDLLQLQPENFDWKKEIITVYMIKSKLESLVQIPISPRLKRILSKYENNIITGKNKNGKFLEDQKYNEALKEIGKIASEIDPSFKVIILVMKQYIDVNDMKQEYIPLYKLLSSHVARRSFITSAIRSGVNDELIKMVSGHKKDSKSFTSYVKFTNTEAVDVMKQASFLQ